MGFVVEQGAMFLALAILLMLLSVLLHLFLPKNLH